MAIVNCKSKTNEPDSIIEIEGISDEKVIINYSSDIDFTTLITKLTELIDVESKVIFENEILEEMSDKTKLVLATLDSIFDSYNNSITDVGNEEIVIPEQANDD